jgi:exonuclease III
MYGPNNDSPGFFTNIANIVEAKAENMSPIVLVGDFNVAMEQQIDTCNYLRENNPRARQEHVNIMARLDLVDEFRQRNKEVRRCT